MDENDRPHSRNARLPFDIHEVPLERLFDTAAALDHAGHLDEAIQLYFAFIKRSAEELEDIGTEPNVAAALEGAAAIIQGSGGNTQLALRCYDNIVQHFGNSSSIECSAYVASALFNAGVLKRDSGHPEDALARFEDVIRRFGNKSELTIRRYVALALHSKGLLLYNLAITANDVDRFTEACDIFADVVERFANDEDGTIRVRVARSLSYIGEILEGNHLIDKAQLVFDDIIRRFGAIVDPEIESIVSSALRRILISLPTTSEQSSLETELQHSNAPYAKMLLELIQHQHENTSQASSLKTQVEQSNDPVAKLLLEATQLNRENIESQHKDARRVVEAFSERQSPFALYLRNFDPEAHYRLIMTENNEVSSVAGWGEIQIESELAKAFAGLVPLIGIVNREDLKPRASTDTIPKLCVDTSSWVAVVRALINAALFIVVYVEEITPGLDTELDIITEQNKQDNCLVLLQRGTLDGSLGSLMEDALSAFKANYVQDFASKKADKNIPELRRFTHVFYTDEIELCNLKDHQTIGKLLAINTKGITESGQVIKDSNT